MFCSVLKVDVIGDGCNDYFFQSFLENFDKAEEICFPLPVPRMFCFTALVDTASLHNRKLVEASGPLA